MIYYCAKCGAPFGGMVEYALHISHGCVTPCKHRTVAFIPVVGLSTGRHRWCPDCGKGTEPLDGHQMMDLLILAMKEHGLPKVVVK